MIILIVGGACQGKSAFAKSLLKEGWHLEDQYHLKVKEDLEMGRDPLEEAQKLLRQFPSLVVVSNEMGYGIVPTDPFERAYRESNGRVNCYFAQQAHQVYRVICGIGRRMK